LTERNPDNLSADLSAYLDGRLSADQMAEVAAHLQSCSACSALLEKMAGLDKLAAESLNDFDDAVLSDLERKIADKIEALPAPEAVDDVHKSRIFPIWQKYIAVAASIAVLFLVGRMAFKENVPPLNSPTLEAPAVRSTTPVDTQPAQQLINSQMPIQPHATPPSAGRDIKGDKNAARYEKESGKDEDVHIIDNRSITGMRKAADEKLQNAPAVEGKLKKAVQNDQAAEAASPAGNVVQNDAQPPKTVGQSEIDVNNAPPPGVTTTSLIPEEKPASKVPAYSQTVRKITGARSGSQYLIDNVNVGGSLQSSYQEAVKSYIQSSPVKGGQGFAAKSRGSAVQDTLSAVNALLQTLQNETVQPGLQDSLKALYLQSCAHYDIYRLSGQQEHYATALRLKDSLQQLTVERIDTTAATAYLKAYLQEIEALQLTQ